MLLESLLNELVFYLLLFLLFCLIKCFLFFICLGYLYTIYTLAMWLWTDIADFHFMVAIIFEINDFFMIIFFWGDIKWSFESGYPRSNWWVGNRAEHLYQRFFFKWEHTMRKNMQKKMWPCEGTTRVDATAINLH